MSVLRQSNGPRTRVLRGLYPRTRFVVGAHTSYRTACVSGSAARTLTDRRIIRRADPANRNSESVFYTRVVRDVFGRSGELAMEWGVVRASSKTARRKNHAPYRKRIPARLFCFVRRFSVGVLTRPMPPTRVFVRFFTDQRRICV